MAPAKGNSVFDAPKVDLAAGRQLGFTPSSAGDLPFCYHVQKSLFSSRSPCHCLQIKVMLPYSLLQLGNRLA